MKLNSNTKKVLLFVALLIGVLLIRVVFGGKNEESAQQPGSTAELTALAPEELTRNEPSTDEDLTAVPEESISEAEPVSEAEEEPISETDPVTETETVTETEPVTETETETASETETETEPVTERTTETETEPATKTEPKEDAEAEESGITVREDGEYSDKEHVALYIHTYGHLPSNYITKKEANALGWPDEGYLKNLAPGKSIGGDYFGNYEGLLPKKKGRKYYECDIDFKGKGRNAKRIIYSNDGLIYYTEDHYETFELLYGGE